MPYVYLVLAILFEVGWAACLKPAQGFTRLGPSVALVVLYALSLVALTLAVRRLPLGMSYAVWTGTGAAVIAIIGYLALKEPMPPLKLVSLLLVVIGVVGLHAAEPGQAAPSPVP